jgi:hypothetical protein
MPSGFSNAQRNGILDALAGRALFAANTTPWVKLHTGDPGASGATAAAGETTRVQSTFGAAAASGSIANTADIQWTNVSTAETYSWISFWSASTAGTFYGNAQLTTARTVAVGDTFTIATGSLTFTAAGT